MPKRMPPQVKKILTPAEAFKPMVKVQATRTLSGWISRDRGVKWEMRAWAIDYMDDEHAREYAAKGHVLILEGAVKPVSPDEADEMLGSVTTINMGALTPNG